MSLELLKKAVELLERGRAVALATVIAAKGSVPGKTGAKMLVLEDGTQHGTVGGAGLEMKVKAVCLEALRTGHGGFHHYDLMHYKEGALDSLCGGAVDVAVEVLAPRPHVLLCGGGHVGTEVARLLDPLEYGYSILDDRSEYASVERFPKARGRFVSLPAPFFREADLEGYSHLLILGYSHRIDTEILAEACRRFPRWIGVIASRAKQREMFRRVKAMGVTDEQLARVESPVGIAIGAESPAEIAVSIVAAIIRQVKSPASPKDSPAASSPQTVASPPGSA